MLRTNHVFVISVQLQLRNHTLGHVLLDWVQLALVLAYLVLAVWNIVQWFEVLP